MKAKRQVIGINRPLDNVGRVCLPVEFRKELGIEINEILEIKLVSVDRNKKVIEISKKEN